MVNLVEDHEFISEEYYLQRLLEKPKTKPRELMLKVENIISLWRVVMMILILDWDEGIKEGADWRAKWYSSQ